MSEEERLLKFENELNFGIETRDGTYYVPKDVAVKAAPELLDELAQPQLTIPKSIADEIDCVVNPIGQIVLKSGILSDFTVEAISWIYKNNENGYIAIAYANPLTHDLVKVVEG
ncbi:hypothetical protein ABLU29_11585 [Lactococcus lactis]|uniref:Uncharacterized protein n=1 Tax=Lactococcus lactis subsp. lactis TaxID=1360 RepID=A0A0V8E309_LACLL|nr:hypothetical protein [Lactococcus lactis]KSU20189.1 hypothetical protein M20_1623 [Lactococcus lactis subsp. lactis]